MIDPFPDVRTVPVEFARYLTVSLLALGVDVAILTALVVLLSWNKPAAGAIAYAVGLAVHYELAVSKVFAFRRLEGRRSLEFGVYAITGLVGIVTSYVVILIGTAADLPLWASKAAAVAISFVLIYFLRRHWLFTRRDAAPGRDPT